MAWVGVDLDGTLAFYDGWQGPEHIGPPITLMLDRVKLLITDGVDVRIFTARAWSDGTVAGDLHRAVATIAISEWCERHVGKRLPITCQKDFEMVEYYDDRSIQVEYNTGRRVDAL